MNITSADGNWQITREGIRNLNTGELKPLERTPSANKIAHMNYEVFLNKCQQAFITGVWPQTRWSSGSVTD